MPLAERLSSSTDLIDSLLTQRLVMGDGALAEAIAQEGDLVEYSAGENLIVQGGGR